MANSADPDKLASSEANWSGSTLFAKAEHLGSAGQGLKAAFESQFRVNTVVPKQTI